VAKEALLMAENRELQGRSTQARLRCQKDYIGGTPSSLPCAQPGKVIVDSLVLCERHALEAKLEGQISCWVELLFHIDLWSREASRRNRPAVARLLEVQREEATSAIEQANVGLDLLLSETPRPI
jgi:hypothetical protein